MALQNGYYAPITAKKVSHWPGPDKDGTGEAVYENMIDQDGNVLGRNQVKDPAGNAVYNYEPPEGYRNIPSFDNTANYTKMDPSGRVWRHPITGEALVIKPGETVIEHPNGDFTYLRDDYSRYLFEHAHQLTEPPVDQKPLQARLSASQQRQIDEEKDRQEFLAWRAVQKENAAKKEAE